MSNRIIEEHKQIWREFHAPSGITLRESKDDWLELLADDPAMQLDMNWGDLARTVSAEEVAGFKEWMERNDDE